MKSQHTQTHKENNGQVTLNKFTLQPNSSSPAAYEKETRATCKVAKRKKNIAKTDVLNESHTKPLNMKHLAAHHRPHRWEQK